MPRIDAFRIGGLDIRFHSNDHLPPHFHVTKPGEWSIRVFVLETTPARLAYDVQLGTHVPAPTRRLLAEKVSAHRVELLREWEAKVRGGGWR